MEVRTLLEYYVLFMFTKYGSMEEVKANAPEELAAHLARSYELHRSGAALMAGAFHEGNAEESVSTMGVFPLREPAEEFANRDRIPIERHGARMVHKEMG
jgi:hypothetical protein